MGVAAVPGSGKTHVLSRLAAQLVFEGGLGDDQEVLIVTLVNASVANFRQRIDRFIAAVGLPPRLGYRVRTLHGLAHDIVRERPGLVGLPEDFAIVADREADLMLSEAVTAWLAQHPEAIDEVISPDLDQHAVRAARKDAWPRVAEEICKAYVRLAKDLELTPAALQDRLNDRTDAPMLVRLGTAVYADYQRALAYRNGVDYADLIRLALLALRSDADYLARLRRRWPYLLEDEAQDSDRLQEEILRLLVGPSGHWVRVGDPNQAIYETFTTASPRYLLDFLGEPGVQALTLPESGRSTESVMALANHLVAWVRADHPVSALREALSDARIMPVPEGDAQPNPPDDPSGIWIQPQAMTPDEELQFVVRSVARWLPDHADATVAVLTASNERGAKVAEALRRRGVPVMEMLRSTRETRQAAKALGSVLDYLAQPEQAVKLAATFEHWRSAPPGDTVEDERRKAISNALRRCRQPEQLLWSRPDPEQLAGIEAGTLDDAAIETLLAFRTVARRWVAAVSLPIDQLVLTIAQDLFLRPADLALAYKLASLVGRLAAMHPDWALPKWRDELEMIAKNERKFIGIEDEDAGFDPEAHRGVVVVTTLHKAKGLEWDRVYLTSANNYDFPSALPGDTFIGEKWWVAGRLHLEAEALTGLRDLVTGEPFQAPGTATAAARLDYAAERVRLLYVGITRARRELAVSWNTGRNGSQTPAAPLFSLMASRERN
jgi:DNA helicase-2/ATP-dependent DNA helicase PcrA